MDELTDRMATQALLLIEALKQENTDEIVVWSSTLFGTILEYEARQAGDSDG